MDPQLIVYSSFIVISIVMIFIYFISVREEGKKPVKHV